MAKAKRAVPEGYQTLTPVLTLDECRKAMDWYKAALGAEELSSSTGPDGKVMHAELQIGSSRVMVHDSMLGDRGPKELGGSPAGMWLFVEDCDSVFNRAVSAGAKVRMRMDDQFWGDRCGTFVDPFGFGWAVATRKQDFTRAEMDQRAAEYFRKAGSAATG
jgi:PhnB protein